MNRFGRLMLVAGLALGLPASGSAVVGGEISPPEANLWQIGLVPLAKAGQAPLVQNLFCGAVLIAPDLAVTAAHCLDQAARHQAGVVAVAWADRRTGRGRPAAYHLHHRDCHDGWTGDNSMRHDLAVIRLARPVDGASPIIIAPPSLVTTIHRSIADGGTLSRGILSGWGLSDRANRAVGELRTATVPIVAERPCRANIAGLPNPSQRAMRYRHDLMLCATRSPDPENDNPDAGLPCRGDSGGPLSIVHEGTHYLIGVSSWVRDQESAKGCATGPAFFSDLLVPEQRVWLDRAIANLPAATETKPLDADDLRCPSKPQLPSTRGEKS